MTTCEAMLERMLDAELDELAGRGDATLAMHVRACARCRAVADQLLLDTEMLGRSIRSVNGSPRIALASSRSVVARRVPVAAAIAIAASLAIVTIRPWRHVAGEARVASAVRQEPASTMPSEGPAAHSSGTPAPPPVVRAPRPGAHDTRRLHGRRQLSNPDRGRAVEVAAVTVAPVTVAATDPAVPIQPVKLDVAPRPSLGSAVAVDPPAGTRVDIIQTDRRGVTVVWLR